jgi:polysaccharide pyruvyl transferase WcaK-like protein
MEFGRAGVHPDRVQQWSTLINEQAEDAEISILCFQRGAEIDDARAARSVTAQLDDRRIARTEVLEYDGTNLDRLRGELANCHVLFATRFHAMVLGVLEGIPTHALVYHEKTRATLDDILGGVPEHSTLSSEPGALPKILVDIDNEKLAKLRQSAAGHFDPLDRILG